MAVNYWRSTHYKCAIRPRTEQDEGDEERELFKYLVCDFIREFGKSFGVEIKEFSLCYIPLACIMLAMKVEEQKTQQSGERIIQAYQARKSIFTKNIDKKHAFAAEVWLTSEMSESLIVYHPYSLLVRILRKISIPKLSEVVVQSYNTAMMTDAVLYFHPHVIAIGCILYSAALLGIDLRSWAETLSVDMEECAEVGNYLTKAMLLSLSVATRYDGKSIERILNTYIE